MREHCKIREESILRDMRTHQGRFYELERGSLLGQFGSHQDGTLSCEELRRLPRAFGQPSNNLIPLPAPSVFLYNTFQGGCCQAVCCTHLEKITT